MINVPIEPRITSYLHNKAVRNQIPLNGTFELTPLCNMNCRMCYVRLSKQDQEKMGRLRSVDEWLALAEKCKKAGMLYLLLTGGEPFLYPGFQQLVEQLHKMGFIISINSNGTMIDENVIAWLKHCPPVRINITLYGASDETYARLCRNPVGFTQVTKAIRLLRETGITMRINCSVTPYNCADLEPMINFCKTNGLLIAPTAYMFPPLRKDPGMIGQNDRFSPQEAAYYQGKTEQLLIGDDRFMQKVSDDELDGLYTDLEDDCLGSEGEGLRCRAGKSSFWVTWNGKVLPCGMFPATSEYKNAFEEDFAECWKTVLKVTGSIRLPAKCAVCRLKNKCRACAAMVLTESGNFTDVPVYRCEMAHLYHQECLKIVEEIKSGAK